MTRIKNNAITDGCKLWDGYRQEEEERKFLVGLPLKPTSYANYMLTCIVLYLFKNDVFFSTEIKEFK